jgi:hypothetical protein
MRSGDLKSHQLMRNFTLHPLMHTLLDFNLAQSGVGGQVNAVEKITPIDPMPMGAREKK